MCLSKEALIAIGKLINNSRDISYDTFDLINKKIYSEFGAEKGCKVYNIMYNEDSTVDDFEGSYKY